MTTFNRSYYFTLQHKNAALRVHSFLPQKKSNSIAIIMCPPFMHENFNSTHVLTSFAESFAQIGITVFRFSYRGTDYSNENWEDFSLSEYREDIKCMVEHVHSAGFTKIGLYGLRLGASLAITVAEEQQDVVSFCIIDEPILSGKQYLHELILYQILAQKKHNFKESETTIGQFERMLYCDCEQIMIGFRFSIRHFEALKDFSLQRTNFNLKIHCLCNTLLKTGNPVIIFLKSHFQTINLFEHCKVIPKPFWTNFDSLIDNDYHLNKIKDWLENKIICDAEKSSFTEPSMQLLKSGIEINDTIENGELFLSKGSRIIYTIIHPEKPLLHYSRIALIISGIHPRIYNYPEKKEIAKTFISMGIPLILIDLPGIGDNYDLTMSNNGINSQFKKKDVLAIINMTIENFYCKFNPEAFILYGHCLAAGWCISVAQLNSLVTHLFLTAMPTDTAPLKPNDKVLSHFPHSRTVRKIFRKVIHPIRLFTNCYKSPNAKQFYKSKSFTIIKNIVKQKRVRVLFLYSIHDELYNRAFWDTINKNLGALSIKKNFTHGWELRLNPSGNHLSFVRENILFCKNELLGFLQNDSKDFSHKSVDDSNSTLIYEKG